MSNYWQRRETLHLAKLLKDEKKYEREIEKIYRNMLDAAQKEIEAFYGRYADKEGITITEARKRVAEADIKAFERKAERYVRDKDFSKQANEEMRLYNATMKINRLEMLKANIGLELLKGGSELEKFMGEILQGRTIEELERQAGILGKTIKDNKKLAHAIANQSWQNADFSTRLWGNMAQMRADIGKLLEQGMIQGKNARVLAKELERYYIGDRTIRNPKAGAKYYAERLMRTELTRVQTEAQRQSFEKNGFTQYRFIVNAGCCDKCRALASHNAGIYDLADMKPGENAPPVHPHDRCSTAAYEDSNEYEAWLDYLDKGGTTISWNEYRKNGGPIVLPNKNGKAEREESKPKYEHKETVINKTVIDSPEYRRRLDKLTDDTQVNRSVWQNVKDMLYHRTGTKFEDLAFIDSKTGTAIINKAFDKENTAQPNKSMKKMLREADEYTIIAIHNHPGSSAPSMPDIMTCIERRYKFGVVACHDGKIYKYAVDDKKFDEIIASLALANLDKNGYNDDVKKMFKDSGIDFEVL